MYEYRFIVVKGIVRLASPNMKSGLGVPFEREGMT